MEHTEGGIRAADSMKETVRQAIKEALKNGIEGEMAIPGYTGYVVSSVRSDDPRRMFVDTVGVSEEEYFIYQVVK